MLLQVRVVFRNFDEGARQAPSVVLCPPACCHTCCVGCADKSGSVDYNEFRKGLAHIGIALTDVDFETLIDTLDNDKSG